jgi:hypothetical protein
MGGAVSNFGKEIKEFLKNFKTFSIENKGVIILLVVALLILYGQRLFYYDISIDSELAVGQYDTILRSWIAIDRFGLVLTKKIFGFASFVPAASNFLMVITIGFTSFFFTFCVNEWNGKTYRRSLFNYIFSLAYISAPCLAEQFYFTLQAFEIAFAGLLCILSVYCIGKWIFKGQSILWLLPGMISMVWSFGSYQAFLALFIAVCSIAFLLYYQNAGIDMKRGQLRCFLKFIIIFIIGFIVYLAVSKAAQLYYNVYSAYVDNMIGWRNGIDEVLNNIGIDVERIYKGNPIFFSGLFTPVLILCLALMLFRGWKARRKGYFIYILAIMILAVSPILLTVASGSPQPIRGQLVYPFVFAFCVSELTTFSRRAIAVVFFIIGFITSWYQGQTVTRLFHTAHMTYENDKLLAASVYKDIEKAGIEAGLDEYTVVFYGSRSADLPQGAVRGDVIGYSFFEWDLSSYAGATSRIVHFCETLGLDLQIPTEDQAASAWKTAEDMPVWPADGGICVEDGIIIIKLSEMVN